MDVSTGFLKSVLGEDKLISKERLEQRFIEVMHVYKNSYPKYKTDSLTYAFLAMEFVMNAEVYFADISPQKGKAFFAEHSNKLLDHFDYNKAIGEVSKGDYVLALSKPSSDFRIKWNTQGVLGKFYSMERHYYCIDTYENEKSKKEQQSKVFVQLEIANNGIISLPVFEMVYFEKWRRKLELIM